MAAPDDCYHAGMRGLQDRFDTHRLDDRLAERLSRERFTDAQSTAAGRAVTSDLAANARPAIIRAFPVGV